MGKLTFAMLGIAALAAHSTAEAKIHLFGSSHAKTSVAVRQGWAQPGAIRLGCNCTDGWGHQDRRRSADPDDLRLSRRRADRRVQHVQREDWAHHTLRFLEHP